MSTLKVNSIQHSNGTDALTIDSTGHATFNKTFIPANPLTNRNLIINGDMRIAQRGTSSSSITTSGYTTVDRWTNSIGTAGTWTISQDTDVPTGQGFSNSHKYNCTTANGSLSAGSELSIIQMIEAQNLQHLKFGTSSAENLTVSFWVKSNKTGTYIFELYQWDDNRAISKSYTIDSADTWEKKTITIEGDTTGVIDNNNDRGFQVAWWIAAGSNNTSGSLQTSWGTLTSANRAVGQVNLADSTSNYINITGVQLEVGDTATPFEHRPYDMELARCQRYYFSSLENATTGYYIGPAISSSRIAHSVQFPVSMRGNPTVVIYSPYNETAGKVALYNATSIDIGSGFVASLTRPQAVYYLLSGSGMTTGNYYSYKLTADAEL